jgi:hypothetical protein
MGKRRTAGKALLPTNRPVHQMNSGVQLMIREQDRAMDSIVGTLSTLAQQAGLMGQEIVEHNE